MKIFRTEGRQLLHAALWVLPVCLAISIVLGYRVSPGHILAVVLGGIGGEVWLHYYRSAQVGFLPTPALICILAGVASSMDGYLNDNPLALAVGVFLAICAIGIDLLDRLR